MATTVMTVASERLGRVSLVGATANVVDGDYGEIYTLPAGFGDLFIERAFVTVSGIATLATTPELLGVAVSIVDAATSTLDWIGMARWQAYLTAGVCAYFDLTRQNVLFRQNEQAVVQSREMDTNASPTGDLRLYVTGIRLRAP